MSTYWIINQYAQTPTTGRIGRHLYLARELVAKGHTVYLVGASFTHLFDTPVSIAETYDMRTEHGVHVVRVSVPAYKGSSARGRVGNWIRFAYHVSRLDRFIKDAPDAIMSSSPSILANLGARRLVSKFKCRHAFEVRDIWPLTLIEVGGYSPKHPFIRLLQWVEDSAYQTADQIVSNLPKISDHIAARGTVPDKFTWIPNGYSQKDLSVSDPLDLDVVAQLPKAELTIGYTGSHGIANALSNLLNAAKLLKDQTNIAFVLVGKGAEKDALKRFVADNNLQNVAFIDPIPKSQIPDLIDRLDACYIGLTPDPLFRFGVSPNKLFDYFIAAKPILYAIDSGDYHPVTTAQAGFEVPPANPQALADAILQLQATPEEDRVKMGQSGRAYVEEQHEFAMLADTLDNVLSVQR